MATKRNSGIRQKTHDRVDSFMDKAGSMKERGMEAMDQLKEKAIMMKENVDDRISRNPEKSMLIAAGIGVIIGAIITIAMRRR